MKFSSRIFWCDVETTGVDPNEGLLLEVSAIVSKMDGKIVSPQHTYTIWHNVNVESLPLSDYVRSMHSKSGLFDDLRDRRKCVTIEEADEKLYGMLVEAGCTDGRDVFFGGSSITLDRNFVKKFLPRTYSVLHHRSIDVTSVSLTVQSALYNVPSPKRLESGQHRAANDILKSYHDYMFYRSIICGGRKW